MQTGSPTPLLESTWPLLAILPLFLLSCSSARVPCYLTFDTCQPHNPTAPKWQMECDVILIARDFNNSICNIPKKTVLPLDSEKGSSYDSSCDMESCSIRAHWCEWGSWSKPSDRCGVKVAHIYRYRDKCCHPVTRKRDERRVKCAKDAKTHRKLRAREGNAIPAPSCPPSVKNNENEESFPIIEPDSGITSKLITAFAIGVFVLIIIVVVRCVRRKHQALLNRHLATRAALTSTPSAPPLPTSTTTQQQHQPRPAPALQPLHEPRRVIRPSTPPPAHGAPPPYNSAWRSDAVQDIPDAADPESPPPQYEAALRLTS